MTIFKLKLALIMKKVISIKSHLLCNQLKNKLSYTINNLYVIFIGQLYGIEKFWAFMKYYKHANKLEVEPRLKEHLSKFKTIEDFRVLEPQINEMLEGVGNLRQSPDKRRHRSISESEGVAVPSTSINRSDVTIGRNESNFNRKR